MIHSTRFAARVSGIGLLAVVAGIVTISTAAAHESFVAALESSGKLASLSQSSSAESYPFLSNDGQRLYYVNASNQIMVAARDDLNQPFRLAENTQYYSYYTISGFWISPDELELYFITSTGSLYRADRNSKENLFPSPQSLTLSGTDLDYPTGISMTPNCSELLVHHKDSIIRYVKSANTSYTYQGKVDAFSNRGAVGAGHFSKDGLRFYITTKNPSSLYVYTRESLSSQWDGGAAITTSDDILQPSVAGDEVTIVYVGSLNGSWSARDLYEGRLDSARRPFSRISVQALISFAKGSLPYALVICAHQLSRITQFQ